MVYIGVDLHRKISHVVALDEAGSTILSRRFEHSPDAFRRVFGELEPEPITVAFEATYGWGWFADLLADAGIEAHMAHPLATKAIGAGRVKNDAVDAATLAHLLRTNLLPEAWIAPPEVRELRRLVRLRASLVRIRSRLKCQVHAICADAGIPVPVSDLFGRKGRAALETLALPPHSASRPAAHLRLIDDLAREIVAADRASCFGRRPSPAAPADPGIGINAATIVAEVWTSLLGRPFASWVGLTPTERSSATSARPHQRRQLPAALGDGGGRGQIGSPVGQAPPLADPIADDKIARVALAAGSSPRLLCPPRRAGLPDYPPLSSVAPAGHGALATVMASPTAALLIERLSGRMPT